MDDKEKAVEAAVKYISYKPRTKFQTENHLKNKGFSNETIEKAVSAMEEYNYLDDYEYSKMYYSYGFDKGRGVLRIKRELAEKGISSDIIEDALYNMEDAPNQNEQAEAVAMKILGGKKKNDLSFEERKKLQAKIGRNLYNRGFSSDVIYDVINRVFREE